ncbi:chloride channel protein [uncultured Rhodospira sp.]|uniref:chloride channel protein n=1 Tax=uncultured Rhodospira sp. TaxID=1936189 RepID=UPI00261B3348|nr:chloride channel protein [uncultured Rhodospira sp.]
MAARSRKNRRTHHFARRVARRVVRRTAALRPRHLTGNGYLRIGAVAAVVGLLTGGGIIAFREGITLIQAMVYGAEERLLATTAGGLPWWVVALTPAVGGLVVGLWHRAFLPEGRPENVSHVIEAAILRGGRMPLWRGIAAAVGSMASLGVGASVGREGPAVHLGATLGAWVAKISRLGHAMSRTLLGCGAAAAVAASFNAPIAGALFAHEVVVGHYAASAFAPVVISSVAATVLSRQWFGAEPAFALPPDLTLASFGELPAFALLGVVCGLVAATFMVALTTTDATMKRSGVPTWLRPVLAGVAVGVIAQAFPEVLGVGYEVTNRALSGELALDMAVATAVAKGLATVICLGFGFGGGVFSPSLAMGAITGCAFGIVATAIAPWDLSSGAGAYAVVGMGAVAAAVLGAPISTSLIIFEMTGNYPLTIAVMTAVVIATAVATGVTGHRSVFHWQLARRGLDVDGDRQRLMLKRIAVRDLVVAHPPTLAADATLEAVAAAFRQHGSDTLFVTEGETRRLLGTITLADVAEVLLRPDTAQDRTALDLAFTDPPVLALSDSLDQAMDLLEDHQHTPCPVVRDRASMVLAGVVHERHVTRAYADALSRLRAEDRGEPV